ncbi:MAG: hypothetical protein PHG44_06445 [Lentisphaeria bacterium]|nr:hypothetical protein [Lentisphaeria bacterium]
MPRPLSNLRGGIFGLAVLLSLALQLALRGDELLFSGQRLQGIFLGMDKASSLSFQVFGEEQPRSIAFRKISSLSLDKPLPVGYALRNQGKKLHRGSLHGYVSPNFLLQAPGEAKPRQVSAMQLLHLKYDLDMRDYMLRMQAFRQEQAAQQGKADAARSFPLPGKTTVVYFGDVQLQVNARQANLCQRLCEESKKPAAYVPLLLASTQEALAKELGLKTLPQFWFYKADGTISSKLSGRFTEADIENAFKKAAK